LLFPCTKSPPSSQKIEEVACAVFRRWTAPGEFSHAENPPRSAAGQAFTRCHCSRRRPSAMSRTALESAEHLQAPRNAASGRTSSGWRPTDHPPKASVMERGGKPLLLSLQQISHRWPEQPRSSKPVHRANVTLETTPPRRKRHPQASSSLVHGLDRAFTPRQCATRWWFQIGALSRESDARRRHSQSTRGSMVRAYARNADHLL
jgi:hypothetical protein